MRVELPSFLTSTRLFAPKFVVGLDSGAYAIKVVKATPTKNGCDIHHCILQPRAEEAATTKLKRTIQKLGLLSQSAAFSIADDKTENHEFHFPKLTKSELATAIQWEMQKTLGTSATHSYDALNFETPQGNDVHCMVASNDIIKGRYEEGQMYRVSPDFLEPDSSALLSCMSMMNAGIVLDRVAVIDLGHSSFRLIFIHKGRISFTRSLYVDFSTLCIDVAAKVKVPPSQIVKMLHDFKAGAAEKEPNPVFTAMEPLLYEALKTLCEEFRKSEYFAKEQKGLEDVTDVTLCGGGACIPFAVDYIRHHLTDKKVDVLNPFKRARSLPKGVEVESGPLWACAVGLSLRDERKSS